MAKYGLKVLMRVPINPGVMNGIGPRIEAGTPRNLPVRKPALLL
jgi:hypothetical protein